MTLLIRESLLKAVDSAWSRLNAMDGTEALLARRQAGRPMPKDAARAKAAAAEILKDQAEDGSWKGGLAATAGALELLHQVAPNRSGATADSVARALAWLTARQGGAGRFGGDCTEERHAFGLCLHFLGGIYAPDVPENPDGSASEDTDLALPNGVVVPAGEGAKLAASCIAVRAVLRWQDVWSHPAGKQESAARTAVRASDVRLHLDGLRRILDLWSRGEGPEFDTGAMALAVSALLADSGDAEHMEPGGSDEPLDGALKRLVREQRGDGSWPGADAFLVLDLLDHVMESGRGSDAVLAAIRRGAALLVASQQADGSWGRTSPPGRLWVGWRVLRRAAQTSSSTTPTVSSSDSPSGRSSTSTE